MGRRTEQHWWSPSAKRDMALLVAVLLLATGLAHRYDAFEWFAGWAANHEIWQVDELAAISMVLVVALAIFATRRWQEAVTEAETHRATTERLQTSEKQFRQGFDAAATGIALVSVDDGRFLRVNPAGCAMLGYAPDELAGMTIQDVTHPDDRMACAERFRRVATGELESSQAKLRYVRRDGSSAHVLVTTAVVRDVAGRPIHMVAHVVDITEQEDARQRLFQLLASKDELIASVSHELRTPLAAVIGYAELLRGDSSLSPSERREMIQAIVEQGSDLANIVEDLLVAARIDADSLIVATVPVDLRAQAAQVLESLDYDNEVARVTLTGSGRHARGDPARVRQILRNLLSNAVRYGGSNIEVVADTVGSLVRLVVSDDGAGVPPNLEQRIFDPYQRAHSREGLTASVGLGLTISRKLARLMDGDLTYARQGERSVFTLVLPVSDELASSGNARPGIARRRPAARAR